MAYLDPMRLELSGSRVKVAGHIRQARVMALSLSQQTLNSGAISGKRSITKADGTKITVTKAGHQMTAQIDSPGGDSEYTTIAIVGTRAEGFAAFRVVDVDAEQEIAGFAFPDWPDGFITGMAWSPNGRYLYMTIFRTEVVRFDLTDESALSTTLTFGEEGDTGFNTTLLDLFMSPDGERIHVRSSSTGIPAGGTNSPTGTYGQIVTLDKDLIIQGQNPQSLFGTHYYRGAVHPIIKDLMYFTAYGDYDDDDDPNGPDVATLDYVPESFRSAYWNGSGGLAGDIVWPFYLAGARGARMVAIARDGERAYVSNSRGMAFNFETVFDGPVPLHTPAPAIIAYNVEDGVLIRVENLLMGVEITGGIATNIGGSRIYVVEAMTGVARVVEYDSFDGYSEGDSFTTLPEDDEGNGDTANQVRANCIAHGPAKGGKTPDTRMFFASNVAKCLTAITPNGRIDKKVYFETAPVALCVGSALKFRRET